MMGFFVGVIVGPLIWLILGGLYALMLNFFNPLPKCKIFKMRCR